MKFLLVTAILLVTSCVATIPDRLKRSFGHHHYNQYSSYQPAVKYVEEVYEVPVHQQTVYVKPQVYSAPTYVAPQPTYEYRPQQQVYTTQAQTAPVVTHTQTEVRNTAYNHRTVSVPVTYHYDIVQPEYRKEQYNSYHVQPAVNYNHGSQGYAQNYASNNYAQNYGNYGQGHGQNVNYVSNGYGQNYGNYGHGQTQNVNYVVPSSNYVQTSYTPSSNYVQTSYTPSSNYVQNSYTPSSNYGYSGYSQNTNYVSNGHAQNAHYGYGYAPSYTAHKRLVNGVWC